MPSKTLIVKRIVSFTAGAGAAKIIAGIAANNTDRENVYDTVTVFAGSVVIGTMVAEYCKQYTDKAIDEIIAYFKEW